MLDESIRDEITAQLDDYPTRRAACIEALMIVQRHHRWVSDEHLADVSELLDMSLEELDSVATFYNLIYRQPVGDHVILVCDSVSCWLTGYEEVRERLFDELGIGLGETTEDGRFTLLPICCLGDCAHAPAMMIDDEIFRNVDRDAVSAILDNFED